MKTHFTLALLLLAKLSLAQPYQYNWTKIMGGGAVPNSIVTDQNGNIYTTGGFPYGVADFDPGPQVFSLNGKSYKSCFISKLDASGNLLWAKKLDASVSVGRVIKTDVSGNVYVSGNFSDTADFDPGPGVYNVITLSPPQARGFIWKLSPTGDLIWVRHTKDIDSVNTILPYFSIDNSSNLILAGNFIGTGDFDLGPGTHTISATGSNDGFLIKMSNSGNFVWAKHFGGVGSSNWINQVKTDNQDNIYLVGKFSGITDFDPGVGTYTMNSTAGMVFITKLSSTGNFIWAKQIASQSPHSYREQLQIDDAFNVYVVGTYSGTCDFDPGIATSTLSSTMLSPYIFKLDKDGNFDWLGSIASLTLPPVLNPVKPTIVSFECDNEGGCYLSGRFSGVASLVFASGTSTLSDANGNNFICKLTNQGHLSWLGQFGGADPEGGHVYAITFDKSYNIFSAGYFDKMDFNPANESDTISCVTATSSPQNHMFISKLSQPLLAGLTNSIHQQANVNVFPNPSRDKFNVEIQGLTGKPFIKLYNLLGEVLQNYEVNEPELVLDVSYYEKGIYILEVVSDNHLVARKKVVKN